MDILDKIFISIAKIYIFFFKENEEQWFYLPLLMIGLIISFDTMCISLLLITIPVYYYVILFFVVSFLLYFKFEKITFELVKRYEMSLKIRFLIYSLIIINFLIMFFLLNYIRNQHIILLQS